MVKLAEHFVIAVTSLLRTICTHVDMVAGVTYQDQPAVYFVAVEWW